MSLTFRASRAPFAVASALLALAALVAAQQSAPRPGEPSGQGGRGGGPGRAGGPARDVVERASGTARIRGVVLSAETGSPIKRAVVRLGGTGLRAGRSAMTDDQGRYEIKELPPGRFTLSVAKAGYITLQYGQRRAFEQGRPLDVADGQLLNGVNISLPRGGVITGRLVDEAGEPIAEAQVSTSRYQFVRGQRRLTPVGRSDQTNDLGQYRLYGLTPGEYVVTATLRSVMRVEQPETVVDGYAPTYFPGTTSASEAQLVRVNVGQEAAADFALIPARLVRISGTVITATGTPLTGGSVRLTDANRLGGFVDGSMARIQGDGTFALTNVAPGAYTLIATNGGPMGRRGGGGGGEVESGRTPITVGAADHTNVLITTGRGAAATGRLVIEGGLATISPSSLRLFAAQADSGDGMAMGPGNRPGRVNEDWTFELTNLFGRVVLSVTDSGNGGSAQRLTLKAVTLNGADVTSAGFESEGKQRIDGLEIVLTTRVTEVSGTVYDGRQKAIQDYVALIFSADESRWQDPNGRYTRVGRPDQEGKFTIVGLPAGNYFALAMDYLESGAESDPEILARLRPFASSVRLGEGEKKTLTLDLSDVQ